MNTHRTICFVMPNISKSAENPWQIVHRCELLASRFQSLVDPGCTTALLFSHGFSDANHASPVVQSALKIHLFGSVRVVLPIFVVKAYRLLKGRRNQRITLISGDNYSALLICIILKFLLGPNVKIQISIHGNPLSNSGSKIKVLVRKAAFRVLVPRASSVRLVSGHLRTELERYFSKEAEIFISPIPVRMSENFVKKSCNFKIGFIGRLHYERGVELFCKILNLFAQRNQFYDVTVIGEGPEIGLLEEFHSLYPSYPLEILGSLSQSEVLSSLQSINILISCASNEGYGLAMREAVTGGTFVVALSNAGTKELKDTFPNMVYLFETVEEAFQIISTLYGTSPDLETVDCYRAKQLTHDELGVNSLITSWL